MKRISKKNALLELAKSLAHCDAHRDKSNPNHLLAVHLSYVLWQIYLGDTKLDEMDMSFVKREIDKM